MSGVTAPESGPETVDGDKPTGSEAAGALRSRLRAWACELDSDEPVIIFSLPAGLL